MKVVLLKNKKQKWGKESIQVSRTSWDLREAPKKFLGTRILREGVKKGNDSNYPSWD